MPNLEINLDPVAAIRETLGMDRIDPVAAAVLAEMSGAESIAISLTEDQKPVRNRDLYILQDIVRTRLNLRISPTGKMVEMALSIAPEMVTLVPPKGISGGVDVKKNGDLKDFVLMLKADQQIAVCTLINPVLSQVKAATKIGADYICISTEKFARAKSYHERISEHEKIATIAKAAFKFDLGVMAGGGLNYQNVKEIAEIEQIETVSVGTAVAAKSILIGFENAVRDILDLIR
ncbi:MAG: pyridoxine 5'-phosphate synthase [Fidelibacterota bacterium]